MLKVNLDFVLPFPVDYSSLEMDLYMFKYENTLFLVISPLLIWTAPKAFRRPILIILRVSSGSRLPFIQSIICTYRSI